MPPRRRDNLREILRLPADGAWPGSLPLEISVSRTLAGTTTVPRRRRGRPVNVLVHHVPAAAVTAASQNNGVLNIVAGGGGDDDDDDDDDDAQGQNQEEEEEGEEEDQGDDLDDEEQLIRLLNRGHGQPDDMMEPRPWSITYLPPLQLDDDDNDVADLDYDISLEWLMMATWRQRTVVLGLLLSLVAIGFFGITSLMINSCSISMKSLWRSAPVHNDSRPIDKVHAAIDTTRTHLGHLQLSLHTLTSNLTYALSSPGALTNLDLGQSDQEQTQKQANLLAAYYYGTASRLATGDPPLPRDAYLGGFLPASIHHHRQRVCAAVLATWFPLYPSKMPAFAQEPLILNDDDENEDEEYDNDNDNHPGLPWTGDNPTALLLTEYALFAPEFRFHARAYNLCIGAAVLAEGMGYKDEVTNLGSGDDHETYRLAWSDSAPTKPGLDGLALVARLRRVVERSGLVILLNAMQEVRPVLEEIMRTSGAWIFVHTGGGDGGGNNIPNNNDSGWVKSEPVVDDDDDEEDHLDALWVADLHAVTIGEASQADLNANFLQNYPQLLRQVLFVRAFSEFVREVVRPALATLAPRPTLRPWAPRLLRSVFALWDMHDDTAEMVRKTKREQDVDRMLLELVDVWVSTVRRYGVGPDEGGSGSGSGWRMRWADIQDWCRARLSARRRSAQPFTMSLPNHNDDKSVWARWLGGSSSTTSNSGSTTTDKGLANVAHRLDEVHSAATSWRTLLPWRAAYIEEWSALHTRLTSILEAAATAQEAADELADAGHELARHVLEAMKMSGSGSGGRKMKKSMEDIQESVRMVVEEMTAFLEGMVSGDGSLAEMVQVYDLVVQSGRK